MHTKETLQRLRWHAGLEEDKSAKLSSVSDCTWLPNHNTHQITEAVEDVLHTLVQLNVEVNRLPVSRDSEPGLAREVIYAINEIFRILRDAADKTKSIEERSSFARAERQVFSGWNAIVAGDIEDLRKHISEEEAARAEWP